MSLFIKMVCESRTGGVPGSAGVAVCRAKERPSSRRVRFPPGKCRSSRSPSERLCRQRSSRSVRQSARDSASLQAVMRRERRAGPDNSECASRSHRDREKAAVGRGSERHEHPPDCAGVVATAGMDKGGWATREAPVGGRQRSGPTAAPRGAESVGRGGAEGRRSGESVEWRRREGPLVREECAKERAGGDGDESANTKECREAAQGTACESEGGARVSALSARRRGGPVGWAGPCGRVQSRVGGSAGSRRRDLRGHRGAGGGAVAWGAGAGAEGEDRPCRCGAAGVESEGSGQTTPVGAPDGPRPSGAGGGGAGLWRRYSKPTGPMSSTHIGQTAVHSRRCVKSKDWFGEAIERGWMRTWRGTSTASRTRN